MVPLAMLQILVLVRTVGRSSTFVSVSSQSPLSIPIGFAAAALTAVLSPLPDDRSVQDLWRLSGHSIASRTLVTRACARLCLRVSRRQHPLRHPSPPAQRVFVIGPDASLAAAGPHRRVAAAYGDVIRRTFGCFCFVLGLATRCSVACVQPLSCTFWLVDT